MFFKTPLMNNAISIMKETLNKRLFTIAETNFEKIFNEITTLIDNGVSQHALGFNLSKDKFIESRLPLAKESYIFPPLLNLGSLVSKKTTPSRIYPDNSTLFEAPFLVPIADSGLAILSGAKQKDLPLKIIEQAVVSLISSLPDGLAKLTIIDKSGVGQNFPIASELHSKITEERILSSEGDIEEELKSLRAEIAGVSQALSSGGFSSVNEYNTKTDEIPLRYNILLISNVPSGFSRSAIENLRSLIDAGTKSGVHVFMTVDFDPVRGMNQLVHGISLQNLLSQMTVLEVSDRISESVKMGMSSQSIEVIRIPYSIEPTFKKATNSNFNIVPLSFNRDYEREKVGLLNDAIEDVSIRPVLSIEKVIPEYDNMWLQKAGLGIAIPFAKNGIQDIFFCFGVNQYGETESTHHAMIGGKTGAGKTILIHDIILMGSMLYSPEELVFNLLDYKAATEFARYKDLPHVKILSMQSEIEFGHEVLDQIIKEMKERGELFKSVGVTNLKDYNKKVDSKDCLPRVVTIIDEFQEIIPKNQFIANLTNEKLDTVLSLGRSFGFNLILSSQTVRGIDLSARLMTNIALRIAMQLDTKDSVKILSEGNTWPAYLRNPGEGIYNPKSGLTKANIKFQAFFVSENDLNNAVTKINKKREETWSKEKIKEYDNNRFIYHGEKEGDINSNINIKEDNKKGLIYIGEPAGLSRLHTFITFERDFAENLLIVGSDQKKAKSLGVNISKQIVTDKKSEVLFFNGSLQQKPFFKKELNIKNISIIDSLNSEKIFDNIYETFLERKNLADKGEDISNLNKIFLYFYQIESLKIFSSSSFTNPIVKKIIEILNSGSELGIFTIVYASAFSVLSEKELARDISKFKKKIALSDNTSLKIFGIDHNLSFSQAKTVSIVDPGSNSKNIVKCKPYIVKEEEK